MRYKGRRCWSKGPQTWAGCDLHTHTLEEKHTPPHSTPLRPPLCPRHHPTRSLSLVVQRTRSSLPPNHRGTLSCQKWCLGRRPAPAAVTQSRRHLGQLRLRWGEAAGATVCRYRAALPVSPSTTRWGQPSSAQVQRHTESATSVAVVAAKRSGR